MKFYAAKVKKYLRLGVILLVLGVLAIEQIQALAPAAEAQEHLEIRTELVRSAARLFGTSFKMGGRAPREGFDASGFVQYVFAENGIALPRTADAQFAMGRPIGKEELLPGDLVFYSTDEQGASFVGICSGSGKFIYVSVKNGVIETLLDGSYWQERFFGARRIIE